MTSPHSSLAVRWCCSAFRTHFCEAGSRGLAVLVVSDELVEEPRFLLQHRAIDQGAELEYDGNVPLTLVTEAHISFCPWCGRKLERWYRRDWRELVRPEIARLELPA